MDSLDVCPAFARQLVSAVTRSLPPGKAELATCGHRQERPALTVCRQVRQREVLSVMFFLLFPDLEGPPV